MIRHVIRLPFDKLDRVLAEHPTVAISFYRQACVFLARQIREVAPDLPRRYSRRRGDLSVDRQQTDQLPDRGTIGLAAAMPALAPPTGPPMTALAKKARNVV